MVSADIQRATGEVLKVFSDKGYAFIRADDGLGDFYFQGISGGLEFDDALIGLSVSFIPKENAKGRRAFDVRPID